MNQCLEMLPVQVHPFPISFDANGKLSSTQTALNEKIGIIDLGSNGLYYDIAMVIRQ